MQFNFNTPFENPLLERFRSAVAACLNKGINIKHNMQGELVDILDTGTANNTFTFNHNLGIVPDLYTVKYQNKAGSIYYTTKIWATATQGTLRCSATNMHVKLWLEFED